MEVANTKIIEISKIAANIDHLYWAQLFERADNNRQIVDQLFSLQQELGMLAIEAAEETQKIKKGENKWNIQSKQ